MGRAMAMSLVDDSVKTRFKAGSYFGPRNANGAVSAPVETPVTTSNSGRVPDAVHPPSRPAPNAPSEPPPNNARKFNTGRFPLRSNSGRLARTCAHFSFTIWSALGGSSSPQKRTGVGPAPTTVASPSSATGSGLRAIAAAQLASASASRLAEAARKYLLLTEVFPCPPSVRSVSQSSPRRSRA